MIGRSVEFTRVTSTVTTSSCSSTDTETERAGNERSTAAWAALRGSSATEAARAASRVTCTK